MSRIFTASDGTPIAYSDRGHGTPILCLSGLTRNASDFAYVAPYLADCRMITMDYRGRGASGWSGPASYTIPVEARDVTELLAHLGLARTAILGTSRGGLIAMALAATVPGLLDGVCLNDIGPELDPRGLADIADYIGKQPHERTHEEAALARARLIPGFANVPHDRWLQEARHHYVRTSQGLAINYDPALALAVAAAGAQPLPDLWPLFDAMAGLPLALIRGENSNLLSAVTAKKMRDRRPDMIYAEVPDRGHVPFLDEPAALAALTEWKARLP